MPSFPTKPKKEYSFYDKNKIIFEKRWPKLWEEISQFGSFESVEFVDATPANTLCIDGIHISSCYNRISESKTQVAHISATATTVWVYGVGTGDILSELVKLDSLKKIYVVLLSKRLFKEAIKYFEFGDWINDPRIDITIGDNDSILNTPFCAVPASLKFADGESIRLRDLVQLELNSSFINSQIQNNPVFQKQIVENYSLVEKDADVLALFKTRQNSTAYVVAAGVSLEDSYQFLMNLKENEFIVAVDGAIRPLARYFLKPDYVVTVDGQYIPLLSLFDVCLPLYNSVPLIYFPIVENSIIGQWQGPRYAAYSSSPSYNEIRDKYPRATLFASGSVIHTAIDLALKMGATKINLVGVDFVFLDGATHTKEHPSRRLIDVTDANQWLITGHNLKNGKECKAATTHNLIAYLRDLEDYIANNTDVKFQNMSRRGAKIKGTSYYDE